MRTRTQFKHGGKFVGSNRGAGLPRNVHQRVAETHAPNRRPITQTIIAEVRF
jgi:hypothetical protein